MSKMREDELINIARGFSEEDRALIIDNLPVDELLAGVSRRYNKLATIQQNIKDIMTL